MFNFLNQLFGGSSVDLSKPLAEGALIVDVRTPAEFASGHPNGAINIPLDQLPNRVHELKASKQPHLIVCCRSGNRSGQAQQFLQSKGFRNVLNGGAWQEVARQQPK